MADDGGGGLSLNPKQIVETGLRAIGLGALVDYTGTFNDFVQDFKPFIQNPPRYIVALIVGLGLWVTNTISDGLNAALALFEEPAPVIGSAITGAGELLGNAVLNTVGTVNQTAIDVALGAGPLAPVGVFVLWLLEMYLVYRAVLLLAPAASAFLKSLVGG